MGSRLIDAPLIGVSTSEVRSGESVAQTPEGEPPRRELCLGLKYPAAVERAGAIPVVLPPIEAAAIEPLLDRLSGLCLSGGPDIDPSYYGGERHPRLGPVEPELDRFEIELVRAAWGRGMPILAICRGAQVLNVARGGTLHPHLPELVGDELEHRQDEPGDRPAHSVRVERDSTLARLIGRRRLDVNSFHHQAVAELGAGLRVVARAPDGVVEAIEAGLGRFAVGVQWHAECMAGRPEQDALFETLADAAAGYEAGGRRRKAA